MSSIILKVYGVENIDLKFITKHIKIESAGVSPLKRILGAWLITK